MENRPKADTLTSFPAFCPGLMFVLVFFTNFLAGKKYTIPSLVTRCVPN